MDKNTTYIIIGLVGIMVFYLFYTSGTDEIGENFMFVALGALGGILLMSSNII